MSELSWRKLTLKRLLSLINLYLESFLLLRLLHCPFPFCRILTIMRPRLPRSSRKNLLYLASVYTEGGGPLSSPGLSSDCSEQPIYTIESLQWRARQENQVKNQGQTVEKQEDVLERDDGVEEVEEEEEEMVTETNPLEGLTHSGNMVAIAEKRAALQGSPWQITAGKK